MFLVLVAESVSLVHFIEAVKVLLLEVIVSKGGILDSIDVL